MIQITKKGVAHSQVGTLQLGKVYNFPKWLEESMQDRELGVIQLPETLPKIESITIGEIRSYLHSYNVDIDRSDNKQKLYKKLEKLKYEKNNFCGTDASAASNCNDDDSELLNNNGEKDV